MGERRPIASFFAGVWRLVQFAGCYGTVFGFFFVLGLILVLLGYDLDKVDVWLDKHSDWFEFVGSILFRIACGIVFLMAMAVILSTPFNRDDPDRPGCGCIFMSIFVAFFAWYGIWGD